MARTLWLFACILLLLSACQQAGSDYIHATIDGQPMRFPARAVATISGDGGMLENATLLAQRDEGAPFPAFEIQLQTMGTSLKPGRYSARTTHTEHPRPGESQTDNLLAQYYPSNDPDAVRQSDSSMKPIARDFIVRFTRIDKTRAEGSFSGQLKLRRNAGVVTVTAGAFSLPVEYVDAVPGI